MKRKTRTQKQSGQDPEAGTQEQPGQDLETGTQEQSGQDPEAKTQEQSGQDPEKLIELLMDEKRFLRDRMAEERKRQASFVLQSVAATQAISGFAIKEDHISLMFVATIVGCIYYILNFMSLDAEEKIERFLVKQLEPKLMEALGAEKQPEPEREEAAEVEKREFLWETYCVHQKTENKKVPQEERNELYQAIQDRRCAYIILILLLIVTPLLSAVFCWRMQRLGATVLCALGSLILDLIVICGVHKKIDKGRKDVVFQVIVFLIGFVICILFCLFISNWSTVFDEIKKEWSTPYRAPKSFHIENFWLLPLHKS